MAVKMDHNGYVGRIEWINFPTRRPDGVFLP